jgi:bifunctional DNA-binding transcriptional regulator/antitoxin component of YhaV-PrlF toxin-antitoxin module
MCDVIADENGNVSLPKEILDQLKVKPGDLISFTMSRYGAGLVRAKNRSMTDLEEMQYSKGHDHGVT